MADAGLGSAAVPSGVRPMIPPLARVVVGTDLLLEGDRAERRSALLPLARLAEIVLVHVLAGRLDRTAESIIQSAAERELAGAAMKLADLLAERGRRDVVITPHVTRGDPAPEIARIADRMGADLICLGSRTHSLLRQVLGGSTPGRLVRETARPVLAVARAPVSSYATVIAGYDFSAASTSALRMAIAVAPISRAIVVHGLEPPGGGETTWGAGAEGPADSDASMAERARQLTEELNRLEFPSGWWTSRVGPGDPKRLILESAGLERADLVVVGTAARTGLPRLVLGSVAEGVLEEATCDVLVVRGSFGAGGTWR